MSIKTFLKVSAILEASAGCALAIVPSRITIVLIGAPLETSTGTVIGRLAGVALISLGLICWLARNDEHSSATKGIVAVMLFYNLAAAALLAFAAVQLSMTAICLLPAILLHTGLGIWGVKLLGNQSA